MKFSECIGSIKNKVRVWRFRKGGWESTDSAPKEMETNDLKPMSSERVKSFLNKIKENNKSPNEWSNYE